MSQQFVRQASLFRIPWVNRPPQPPPLAPPEASAPRPLLPPTTQESKSPPLPERQLSSSEIQIQSVSSQEYSRPSSPTFRPSQQISSQPTTATSPTKTSTTSPSGPPLEDSSPPLPPPPPPPSAVNESPLQQQQTETASMPSKTPDQTLPTAQATPQSALPPDQSSGQQQLRQSTSLSIESLSGLSTSEFQLTAPNETGDARPALPKTQAEVSYQPISQPEDPTQMKANTELEGVVSKREHSQLGEMEMESLNSIKPQELPAPPQPPSPSQPRNQPTRETSSPPRPPAKLATPTSSPPSSPSKQASHLQAKSIPNSETQPSSPSRLSVIQPEQSTYKEAVLQPLPSAAVVTQNPELKEQSLPKQQLPEAVEQTQTRRTEQSDEEAKELSQARTPAAVQSTPTAVPETKPKETDDGKPEIETETKTKDILASPGDDEPKQRTTAKLPNLASESNKHVAGQSDITTQAEKEKKEKQPTRTRSEMAATAFQAIEGEAAPTPHVKKKTAESWSQTKPSALQGEPASFNKDVNEGFSRYAHKLVQGLQNRTLDGNLASVTVLCGVNTGASMHMSPENLKADQSNIAGEVHAKGESRLNLRRSNDYITREVKASKTYVNNNVQGINNSILYTSSVSEKTPGVHLAFSHQPTESLNMNSIPQNVDASHNVTAVEKDDLKT